MNDYIEYNGNAFSITLTESNVLGLASTDTLSISLETISSDVGKYQENKRYGESFEKFIIKNISIMNNELSVVDSYNIYITMNVDIRYKKIDYNFNDSVNNDGLFTITTDFAYNSELEYIPYSPSLEYITEIGKKNTKNENSNPTFSTTSFLTKNDTNVLHLIFTILNFRNLL